ncbi:MAG: hypothetical protein MHMPM18_000121 [Marteilia pararefringens]
MPRNTNKMPLSDADKSSSPPEIMEYQMGIHPAQQLSSHLHPQRNFDFDTRSRAQQYQANHWPNTSNVGIECDQMTAQSRNMPCLAATFYNPQNDSYIFHNRPNPNKSSSHRHTNSAQSYLNYFSGPNSSTQMPEQQTKDALLTPLYSDGKSVQDMPTLVNSFFIPLKDYQQENKAINSDRDSIPIHYVPLLSDTAPFTSNNNENLSRYNQYENYEDHNDVYRQKNHESRYSSPISDLGLISSKANDYFIDSSAPSYNQNYVKNERMMKNRQIAKVFRARKKTKFEYLGRLIGNEETNIERVKSQLNNSLELAEMIDKGGSDSKKFLEQLIYANEEPNEKNRIPADSNSNISHRMTHNRANSLPCSYNASETQRDYLYNAYSGENRSTGYMQSSWKNREFATGRYTRRSRDPQELSMMSDPQYSTPGIHHTNNDEQMISKNPTLITSGIIPHRSQKFRTASITSLGSESDSYFTNAPSQESSQTKSENDYIQFTMGTYNDEDSKDGRGNIVQIFDDNYTGTKDEYDANHDWPEEKEYEFFP